jgi:hypothetical protein
MDKAHRGDKPDQADSDPRPAAVTFVTTEHFTLQDARRLGHAAQGADPGAGDHHGVRAGASVGRMARVPTRTAATWGESGVKIAIIGAGSVGTAVARAALDLEHMAFISISLDARNHWSWQTGWKLLGPTR